MNKIQKDSSNNIEAVYSYIEDAHIKSYYGEKKIRNSFSLFRVVRIIMFVILTCIVLFGVIGYFVSENEKLVAIPITTTFISITLLVFGLIHPKLVFFVKSRLEVIGLYLVLSIVSFVVAGVMFQ